ncbi:MAG: AmmeMemoRadiSam system radical SAM enzyme [Bacteroidales bacterium]|nr:AmmeMemoRadiSam system radical SAM enzyme [Bacteroidales bacterium]MDD3200526.1 AmmeMemoRadiSam system radical SAM enzyme [Bacteroidales bacterium]
MEAICKICPRHCNLSEGQPGACLGRVCKDGVVVCKNYGHLTAIALDPIEKKPLMHFHPGSKILSVGSYGCNMHCPFCQNYDISTTDKVETWMVSPKMLAKKAQELTAEGNIGVAYTYNEPFISYEYVMDCAAEVHKLQLQNVVVTNGMICDEPLQQILPLIDAMNIDLKAFTDKFYKMAGGDLATVKNTIAVASEVCHVEVTTLIIPDLNDSVQEMEEISQWIASINENIPFHVSRFFPCYKMADSKPTPVKMVYDLADIARKYLKHVYTGNC